MGKTWEKLLGASVKKHDQNEAITEYEILEIAARIEKETGYRLVWEGADGPHDFTEQEVWTVNEKLAQELNKKLKSAG